MTSAGADSTSAAGRGDSFDLLRLLAALAVIAFHSGPLRGRAPWAFGDLNLGALGVGVFFVISGFLVTGSLRRSASLGGYFARRLLRIAPGLIVSLIVTALVIGAYATTLRPEDYFQHPGVLLYVLRNAVLYPAASVLPGVFELNAMRGVVNGSLWTLRVEVMFYIALATLGALRLLKPAAIALIVIALAAATLATKFAGAAVLPTGQVLVVQIGFQYAFQFFAGALLSLIGRPSLKWTVASALLLATPAWMLGLPLVVVRLGRMRSVRLPADLSYGLYIYAFPLQQLLASGGHLSFLTSVALILPFAAASWFLVERPALNFRPSPGGLARLGGWGARHSAPAPAPGIPAHRWSPRAPRG